MKAKYQYRTIVKMNSERFIIKKVKQKFLGFNRKKVHDGKGFRVTKMKTGRKAAQRRVRSQSTRSV